MNDGKTLLVVGASSGIGLETVRAAIAAGWSVKALARRAHSIPDEHANLEKLAVDARRQDQMDAALQGVDAVVQSLGVPFDLKLFTGPIDLFSKATDVLIRSMQARHCRRLLAVTGFGAGASEGAIHPLQRLPFRLVFGVAYQDKRRQEASIKASGLDWTIVRPGVLTQGPLRKNYQVLTSADEWRNGVIARASVAHYLVQSISRPETFGTEPVLIN